MSDRVKIVDKIKVVLEPVDFIHAMWEAGAAAFDRVDEWSDIDLYIISDDDKQEDVFPVIETVLESEFGIDLKYIVPLPPGHFYLQRFYRLNGSDPYELIDLAVFKLGYPDKFLEKEIHGTAKFHFNKNNIIQVPELDNKKLDIIIQHRFEEIKVRFEMFEVMVLKEIHRGNFIEAFDYYKMFTLTPLVELLRIKYSPRHHNFRTRYIHYELPPEIVSRLAGFYYLQDLDDLSEKNKTASVWIKELLQI